MAGYDVLEHTADVGVRATGATLEETFEQATIGLAQIAGVWRPEFGERVDIDVVADDLGALLVDWLSEVLYLHDARGAAIAAVEIEAVEEHRARGSVVLGDLGEGIAEGTQVKAITYHQLTVERATGGWVAQVFFDI